MVDAQQLSPHQSRGWPVGDANRQVDMIVDQIHLTILKQQLHIHLGITAQKLRHMRVNHDSAYRFRDADAHHSLGLISELATDFHDGSGGVDHLLAALEDLLATVAQT
ncbi:hypothetical protein D3C80_1464660 [compost metagenome]